MGGARVNVRRVRLKDSAALGGVAVFMMADDVVDIMRICRRGGARSLAVGAAVGCGCGIDMFVGGRCKAVVIGGVVILCDRVDR